MQTFLPYPDLRASCAVLDDRRLGKQRVETFQILRALTWPTYAWKNHPAVRMWRGFVPALVLYGLENCREWTRRGYADTVAPQLLAWSGGQEPVDPALPVWFGLDALHLSHRSALLRKEPQWYRPLFASLGEPDLPDDLPYLWPPDVFPRWPVRSGLRAQPLPVAASLLGLDAPHAWQAQAAEGVADGRDVLLVARPGHGGSTAGLLAALVTAGRTLWVSPPQGRRAAPAPVGSEVPVASRVTALPDTPEQDLGAPAAPAAAPLARLPGAADLAAMQAEWAPAEFTFLAADHLGADRPEGPAGLVVADRAAELSDAQASLVQQLRVDAGAPPLLVITGRADAGQRAELTSRFGLHQPCHAGGGWDPGSQLEVRAVSSPQAAREVVVALTRDYGAGVVVVPSRERAERLVPGLDRAGLRAALWAPPPMRAARASAALAAWRSRRLDALVVLAAGLPPLGRGRVRLLIAEDPASLDAWRDLVEQVGADRSVLIAGPGAAPEVRRHARAGVAARAELLERFGEPLARS